jgi:hypothetical protein
MVKQDLSELSLTQLSELVRGNPRTVRRRLADAGVKPFRVDGRAMYFRPWEALPAICDDAPRPCGAGGGGPAPLDFLLGGGGPLSTMTGAALCRLLHCDWADVRELLSWSLPFVKAGRPDSPRGWVFAFGHVSRWLAVDDHLKTENSGHLAGETPAIAVQA